MSDKAQQFASRCASALATQFPDFGHGPELLNVLAGSYDAFQAALDQQKKKKNQIPPSVEDVAAFLAEVDYPISAQAFVDHYQAKGWKISKGMPMVDWHSAIRNWKHHGWGQVEGRVQKEMSASLGALQLQFDRVRQEIRDIVFPGGSAHPRASIPEHDRDRYNDLVTQRERLKVRIESGV